MSILVAPCDHDAAKYAVTHWHYSRTMPNQRTVKYGVWEDSRFVGCVVYGDGANPGAFSPYGLDHRQGCELVRVALRQHDVPVSQVVATSLRLLRLACPGLRLVVSFADPEHGHHGGIYQAGNWLYLGMTEPADEYIVNGVRMHGRALRSTRSTHRLRHLDVSNIEEWARRVLDPKIRRVEGSSKHRYVMPLDRAMRRRLQPLALPFPARPAGEVSTGDAPLTGGEGQVRSLQSAPHSEVA